MMTVVEKSRSVSALLGALEEAQPHTPFEPQTPEAVRPYKRALSASSLKMFAECERKWFYRYLCNAIEDPGSAAGAYGTAFHAALEYLHERYPRPHASLLAEMQTELDRLLIQSFERHADELGTPLEAMLALRRAQRTGVQYIRWLGERAARDPFTVVGNETKLSVSFGDQQFVGYIDRLDKSDKDGGITVIDYKTGSIAVSAQEYRDAVSRFTEFQLPLYYWSRTQAGDRVTRLSLIPLKDAGLQVIPVELEVVPGYAQDGGRGPRGAIGIRELEASREKMIEIARVLTRDTRSAFPVTDDPENCGYCAYTEACRDRPRRHQDPFGR